MIEKQGKIEGFRLAVDGKKEILRCAQDDKIDCPRAGAWGSLK